MGPAWLLASLRGNQVCRTVWHVWCRCCVPGYGLTNSGFALTIGLGSIVYEGAPAHDIFEASTDMVNCWNGWTGWMEERVIVFSVQL